jgi:hypothetical protein
VECRRHVNITRLLHVCHMTITWVSHDCHMSGKSDSSIHPQWPLHGWFCILFYLIMIFMSLLMQAYEVNILLLVGLIQITYRLRSDNGRSEIRTISLQRKELEVQNYFSLYIWYILDLQRGQPPYK